MLRHLRIKFVFSSVQSTLVGFLTLVRFEVMGSVMMVHLFGAGDVSYEFYQGGGLTA